MTTDDAAVARFVLARGWATEARIKDALFEQVTAGAATPDGRRRPKPLLSILSARGWITPAQAQEVEVACRGGSVSRSDDSQPSQLAPPDDTLLASEDPSNLYGHLVRVARVGHGGMGTVWRAWDTNLRRWVAMKFVSASQRHLLKEARLGAKLNHPNIVPIYDVVGEESGEPYLVMKFIEGGTLFDLIGEITPDRAAELMMPVAHAVHYAHERGVIHRDLKPKNILIEADGRPVVSDFGLARDLAVASGGKTGYVVGTPAYVAPEQVVEGAPPAGPAADVYGLGATLYHVLTGRPPYMNPSPEKTLEQVRDTAPPPPREVNPDIPPNLERIVLRAMERNVQKRYGSAAEMAQDLDRFLRREPILGLGEEAFAEAVSLLDMGHLRRAVLRLREALRLPWAPGASEESWRPMMRQLKESESSLTLALQIRPTYAVALRHRACLRLARALLLGLIAGRPSADDLAGASADVERALASSPEAPHLQMVRAALWLVRARFSRWLAVRPEEQIRKALGELDRILARSPGVVALHNRALANILLGQHRHRAGLDARDQYRQAIADLEQAIDLDPSDDLLLEDMGRAYQGRAKRQLGNEEADRKTLRQYLERTIQRHPTHAATRLRERLASLAESMPLLEDQDL